MSDNKTIWLVADSDATNKFHEVYLWRWGAGGSDLLLSVFQCGRGTASLYIRHSRTVVCPRCGLFRDPSAPCRREKGCGGQDRTGGKR